MKLKLLASQGLIQNQALTKLQTKKNLCHAQQVHSDFSHRQTLKAIKIIKSLLFCKFTKNVYICLCIIQFKIYFYETHLS